MPVHYQKSLGEDRLALAYYAYKTLQSPTMIIDGGTFLTIDFVNSDGFLGGYIAPIDTALKYSNYLMKRGYEDNSFSLNNVSLLVVILHDLTNSLSNLHL